MRRKNDNKKSMGIGEPPKSFFTIIVLCVQDVVALPNKQWRNSFAGIMSSLMGLQTL